MRPNKTPWVDRTVDRFEDALKSVAPDDQWLPLSDAEEGGVEELGCGHYGCVMPTDSADVVFKLTTDPAESAFVRAALHLADRDPWPAGMIEYKAIYQLAGTRHRNRPVFALWRQEAYEVGDILAGPGWMRDDAYTSRLKREAGALLDNAKFGADAFRSRFLKKRDMGAIQRFEERAWRVVSENFEVLSHSPYGGTYRMGRKVLSTKELLGRFRGDERAAVGLRIYEAAAELMEHNNPLVTNVGSAMTYYREHEIVLADVHGGNIGYASHPEYDDRIVVITDPGHAVFLDDRYDGLGIEELHA